MRVLIIGSEGTVGKCAAAALKLLPGGVHLGVIQQAETLELQVAQRLGEAQSRFEVAVGIVPTLEVRREAQRAQYFADDDAALDLRRLETHIQELQRQIAGVPIVDIPTEYLADISSCTLPCGTTPLWTR